MNEVLIALLKLQKCYKRLLKATPNPVEAQEEADQALSIIFQRLDDSRISAQLNGFLINFNQNQQTFNTTAENYINNDLEKFIKQETKLTSAKPDEIKAVVKLFINETTFTELIQDITSLRLNLESQHNDFCMQINNSRTYSKNQKRLTRNLLTNKIQLKTIGLKMLVANSESYVVDMPPSLQKISVASCVAGINGLLGV
jgi:hypothetical protein